MWVGVQEVLDASMPATSRGAQGSGGRKWYFEKLDLQGIRCNLTLLPHGGAREAEGGGAMAAATRYRMASTLGIHLTEINSVPLRVNALVMKNAFVTPRTLLSQLLRHLFLQARTPERQPPPGPALSAAMPASHPPPPGPAGLAAVSSTGPGRGLPADCKPLHDLLFLKACSDASLMCSRASHGNT